MASQKKIVMLLDLKKKYEDQLELLISKKEECKRKIAENKIEKENYKNKTLETLKQYNDLAPIG